MCRVIKLNGNMTSDLNKGITSITYNHLNLPVEVVYAGDNAVRYSYDASGRRLSAEYGIISWVIDGGGTVEPVNPGIGGGDVPGLLSTEGGDNGASPAARAPSRVKRVKTFLVRSRRDYCGSCLYADGELERILTESGWYSPGGSYTATVNDHQGNLRSTLTKSYSTPPASTDLAGGSGTAGSGDLVGDLGAAGGTIGSGGVIGIGGGTIGGGIVEPQKPRLRYANLTAYSPYGLPLADWQGEERYLYSGKELDRTGGLMLYDFHARQYDPQLGRFTSQDPLQGKYPSLNSYLYCAANPISLTDPTGKDVKLNGENEYLALLYTLPKESWDYVKMNDNGYIDKELINSASFDSGNFSKLQYMANNEMNVTVNIADEAVFINNTSDSDQVSMELHEFDIVPKSAVLDGNDVGSTMLGEKGRNGLTLLPDSKAAAQSLSSNVEVYVASDLSPFGKSEILSHEFYGHAFLYTLTKNVKAAVHNIVGGRDCNTVLKNNILDSKKETVKNILTPIFSNKTISQ